MDDRSTKRTHGVLSKPKDESKGRVIVSYILWPCYEWFLVARLFKICHGWAHNVEAAKKEPRFFSPVRKNHVR
ncbi:hypothetical protein ABMB67_004034 [Halalkalibacter oceani]